MAFQVSPGVNISEIDATTIVPGVTTGNAGIACAFQWGPAEEIITISSEDELVKIFGKPDNETAINWLSASNYLAYAGGLSVVRTIDTSHANASDGASSTFNLLIEDGGDGGYTENETIAGSGAGNGTLHLVGDTFFSSLKQGTGLKVDYTADTNGLVLTVAIDGDPSSAVDPADDVQEFYDGASSGATYYTTILDGDNNAVIKVVVAASSADGTQTASDFSLSVIDGGSGYSNLGGNSIATLTLGDQTAAGGKDVSLIGTITATDVDDSKLITATGTVAGAGLELNDRFVWAVDDGATDANTSVFSINEFTSGMAIKNRSHFDASTLNLQSFIAKYPGELGNSITVAIVHQDTTLATVAGCDLSAVFDALPSTTSYVYERNGGSVVNDEIHVAVIDDDGKISGTRGTALERFAGLSLCTDARNDSGGTNYYKEVINNNSQYIYASGSWDGANSANATEWENQISTTTTPFTDSDTLTSNLSNGAGNNATANSAGNRSGADIGYGLYSDPDTSDVSLLISGQASSALAGAIVDIAVGRKDAIAFYSPESSDVINQNSASQKVTDIKSFKTSVAKDTSYAVMDSGWKRVYDRYNDIFRDIPLNSDIAGLVARTEANRDAWWSPAGYERGGLKNVVKLHFNPPKIQRDDLYKASINPVVSFSGQGIVLFGDKTTLSKPSAFDRINVRRLFIVLEKAISKAAQFSLFEFNDGFTRSQFKSMVEPFLRSIKAKRGIFDYKVVCDSSNNPADVIDRNEFVGDIYIKPARSINFIQLNFVAVRTGVNFNEVAGAI